MQFVLRIYFSWFRQQTNQQIKGTSTSRLRALLLQGASPYTQTLKHKNVHSVHTIGMSTSLLSTSTPCYGITAVIKMYETSNCFDKDIHPRFPAIRKDMTPDIRALPRWLDDFSCRKILERKRLSHFSVHPDTCVHRFRRLRRRRMLCMCWSSYCNCPRSM